MQTEDELKTFYTIRGHSKYDLGTVPLGLFSSYENARKYLPAPKPVYDEDPLHDTWSFRIETVKRGEFPVDDLKKLDQDPGSKVEII